MLEHMKTMPVTRVRRERINCPRIFSPLTLAFAYNATVPGIFPAYEGLAATPQAGLSLRPTGRAEYMYRSCRNLCLQRLLDSDDITNETLGCGANGKCNELYSAFSSTAAELQLYRRMGLPIPDALSKWSSSPTGLSGESPNAVATPLFVRGQAAEENGYRIPQRPFMEWMDGSHEVRDLSYAPTATEMFIAEAGYQSEWPMTTMLRRAYPSTTTRWSDLFAALKVPCGVIR